MSRRIKRAVVEFSDGATIETTQPVSLTEWLIFMDRFANGPAPPANHNRSAWSLDHLGGRHEHAATHLVVVRETPTSQSSARRWWPLRTGGRDVDKDTRSGWKAGDGETPPATPAGSQMKRTLQAVVDDPPDKDAGIFLASFTTLVSLRAAVNSLITAGVPPEAKIKVNVPVLGGDRAIVAEWES